MAERKALTVAFDNSDKRFFDSHSERQAHIRLPHFQEAHGEFWWMGEHKRTQRRVLLWRVPRDNPYYEQIQQPILKIPFLAYDQEDIADDDTVLLPIIDQIMREQAQ